MKNIALSFLFLFAVCSISPKTWAQTETIQWDREQKYDIYYQASEREVFKIRSVKIKDIKLLGDRRFLVCYYDSGFSLRQKELYVAFEDIKAIIPSEVAVERFRSGPTKKDRFE